MDVHASLLQCIEHNRLLGSNTLDEGFESDDGRFQSSSELTPLSFFWPCVTMPCGERGGLQGR